MRSIVVCTLLLCALFAGVLASSEPDTAETEGRWHHLFETHQESPSAVNGVSDQDKINVISKAMQLTEEGARTYLDSARAVMRARGEASIAAANLNK